jgi:transmembrane sensor
MNRSTQVPDPAAEEQASLWAARLEGSILTDSDRAELDAWLAGDPARRALLSSFCRLSAKLDVAVPELAACGAIQMPPERRRPAGAWNPWKLATAGLLAALVAGVLLFERQGRQTEDLSTPAGQRGSFTLSDGTRVELNANTSITVENGRNERRVHLSNGEAFFVVSEDKSRPFTVDTPAGSVRVTGTIFNVLTESASQLDVTVVEGQVQVRPDDSSGVPSANPTILNAGGVLDAEGGRVSITTKSVADIDDDLAWRQGKIVCNAMPVAVALARYSHFYGRSMTATAGAGARNLGGRYDLANLDEFLDYLRQGQGLSVARAADGSIRVSLPGEP